MVGAGLTTQVRALVQKQSYAMLNSNNNVRNVETQKIFSTSFRYRKKNKVAVIDSRKPLPNPYIIYFVRLASEAFSLSMCTMVYARGSRNVHVRQLQNAVLPMRDAPGFVLECGVQNKVSNCDVVGIFHTFQFRQCLCTQPPQDVPKQGGPPKKEQPINTTPILFFEML